MEKFLKNVPCAYISFNDKGFISLINDTLLQLLGYTENELSEKKFESLLNIAGRIFFQTHFFPMLKLHNKADEIFLSLLHKNGQLIPVISNSNRIETKDGFLNQCVFIPIYNRRAYEDELLSAKKAAENALKENSELITSRQEALTHALALDEKVTEMHQLNIQLLQLNKIMNHDMKECIRKILLFSKLSREEKNFASIDTVIASANRLKGINSTLELFITLGLNDESPVPVKLDSILEELINDITEENKNVEIAFFENNTIPVIKGSAWQLRALFEHIINNSIKYNTEPGLKITVDAVTFEENKFKNSFEKYHFREVVRINFHDNGIGIEERSLPGIFNLLKKDILLDNKLSSGLAICKKIVENHNGEISISSTVGIGTTVSVVLPIYTPEALLKPISAHRAELKTV